MNVKSLVHPETISKSNLLYRGWHRLITNRIWQGKVPKRQSICLWFWPALFGTFIFTPILYPILLAIYYPSKYAFLLLLWVVCLLLGGVWKVVRFLLKRPIQGFISLCRLKLHPRLAVGHVLMLLVGVGLAFVPGVNYWVVGVVTVFLVSYIAYWIGFALIATFFRAIWQLLGKLPGLWLTAEKYRGRQTQFWWWMIAVYLLLASPVVLWKAKGVASIYLWIAIFGGAILGLAIGLILLRRQMRRREEEHPSPTRPKPTKPAREPWTKPIAIFLSAKKNEFCPVVEFVD